MRGSGYAELRAFSAVADHGSFVRAAAQLGISPSALSQTIRALEERLGVRLLNRTTRSVAPSQAGDRLLAKLRPALADLEDAIADITSLRDTPSGLLRINSTRLAGVHAIAPMIGPFLAAYPDITFDLVIEERLVDIVAGQFDAGIRLGESVERDMIAVKLGGDLRMLVVAAPSYLARHGRPLTPRDLRDHRCINFRRVSDLSVYRWEFEQGGVQLETAVDGPLLVNDGDVALRAAIDGVGLAYLFESQVDQALHSGALIPVLEDWSPPFPGFYLYHSSRRQTPPPLRAFLDFIAERRGDASRTF